MNYLCSSVAEFLGFCWNATEIGARVHPSLVLDEKIVLWLHFWGHLGLKTLITKLPVMLVEVMLYMKMNTHLLFILNTASIGTSGNCIVNTVLVYFFHSQLKSLIFFVAVQADGEHWKLSSRLWKVGNEETRSVPGGCSNFFFQKIVLESYYYLFDSIQSKSKLL